MLFIGLDVGTTGAKAIVADADGRILGKGYREYELSFPGTGLVEQDAEDWWKASIEAIRCATAGLSDRNAVSAIALSTQGATMLAVDRDGEPLAPAITWMDRRAEDQAERLRGAIGGEALYRRTGWEASSTLDAAKLLWMREERPELFRRAACFVSTLEFMNRRLCGRFVIDPTNAAIRQLFDISTRRWDGEILDAVGVSADRLPEVLPSGEELGKLTPSAARVLGLSEEVRVFNGAHDQYCCALGAGAISPGDMLLSTGTAWVVLGVTGQPLFTPSHIVPGIHPVGGLYGALASLAGAGSALKWYRRLIGGEFSEMDREAAGRIDSSSDLLFYPYLSGAGFPHGRPDVHGTLTGLTLRHDKYDVALALMEGVAFETALTLEQFASNGMGIQRLIMTGGASKSRLWSELVGYATGCGISRMKEPDTGCVGAAMIAAVGLGIFKDYAEAVRAMVRDEPLTPDDPSRFAFYAEKLERYRRELPRVHGQQ